MRNASFYSSKAPELSGRMEPREGFKKAGQWVDVKTGHQVHLHYVAAVLQVNRMVTFPTF